MSTLSKTEPVACSACDLLQVVPPLLPSSKALCPRCGHVLASGSTQTPSRALSLTIAAGITYLVAQSSPLLALSAAGRSSSTTILGGAAQMWNDGHQLTAVLVALCTVVAPAIYIAFMLTVLLAVRNPPAPPLTGTLLRIAEAVRPWSMSEVMLLGILVALIKIAQIADVVPGVGIYAVGVLMVLLALIPSSLDTRRLWERIEWDDPAADLERARENES
ncbi:MAG: paraquat-inducible protein A [Planctomycetota bacterium]|nr:paraquat-inducible protein A [Planctomycetota bacterium]